MAEPAQKPATSRQDYCTPREFIGAVVERFGSIHFDLAADELNRVCPEFFGERDNALLRDWPTAKLCWLNPPFRLCGEFAAKCAQQVKLGARIIMLTPASVGTNWFAESVMGLASVLFLRPRLTFVGADPYPKDLCLSVYDRRFPAAHECWKWR